MHKPKSREWSRNCCSTRTHQHDEQGKSRLHDRSHSDKGTVPSQSQPRYDEYRCRDPFAQDLHRACVHLWNTPVLGPLVALRITVIPSGLMPCRVMLAVTSAI